MFAQFEQGINTMGPSSSSGIVLGSFEALGLDFSLFSICFVFNMYFVFPSFSYEVCFVVVFLNCQFKGIIVYITSSLAS